ncbi:hypothetical protein GFY24_08410 [Nocardia sp. SYP-A9097]|uniref:hypothetical protein n=1 Tax=Nocardia sp. SYP-A9097 TaxID=2663237 RepID=UPI00129A4FD6|nr:hypothetical protein [Nocardia sp. SYP-A9097]MRH87478.1 hypothetical protein [Nocardia sp. SYP-A9097]
MDSNALRTEVDRRLEPWSAQLGVDRTAYTNHVLRVVRLCDLVAPALAPSDRPEFLAAAVFHDLGIWTAGTFDYLAPSERLAGNWLEGSGQSELIPLVIRMIDQHHKVRSAGEADDPVEIFRRADAIDVEMAVLGRFGVSRAAYRQLTEEFPDAGFHRRLLQLGAERLRTHPLSPLPVLKW